MVISWLGAILRVDGRVLCRILPSGEWVYRGYFICLENNLNELTGGGFGISLGPEWEQKYCTLWCLSAPNAQRELVLGGIYEIVDERQSTETSERQLS